LNDLVVKDGGEETFTITAKIDGSAPDNTTFGLAVIDLDTTAEDIDGLPVE